MPGLSPSSESHRIEGPPPPPLPRLELPKGLLDIPFVQDRPRILRFEAGLLLDLHLRRLARVSGAIDRAVALRLRKLRDSRGYVALGFSLFKDYVRERLGLAERTGQELSSLGAGLERLPFLDAALAAGRITWTAAAEVARVAGVEDEREWVEAAERLSVRELRRRVKDARAGVNQDESRDAGPQGVTDDGSPGADGTLESEDPEPEPSDPLVRLAVEVHPATAHLWDAALDLCELVAGADLHEGEAPEYILADFLSGRPAPPDDREPCWPRGAPIKGRRPAPGAWARPTATRPVDRLGPAAVPASWVKEIEHIEDLVRSAVPRDPFDLDESMRSLSARRQALDLDLARLLRNFQALNLARHIGFAGFREYVEERLGISHRRARRLVSLDRCLFFFPAVAAAVREGQIGTEAAWLVCKVAAPERTERAWVEHARLRTVTRLRDEVRWTLRKAREGTMEGPCLPPPAGRLPSALQELSAALGCPMPGECAPGSAVGRPAETLERCPSGTESATLVAERTGLRGPGAETARGEWPTFAGDGSDRCARSATGALTGLGAEAEMIDPTDLAAVLNFVSLRDTSRPRVRVDFALHESALSLWDDARQRISLETGQDFVPDREVLRRIAVEFLATFLPLWFQEVRNGDPVAVRDGFRCQIPGCTVRGGSAHHLRFVSQLGPDEMWNLLFVCYVHHLLGVHRRRIRVHGRVGESVVFELGIRADGTALDTFVNEERRLAS